MEWNAGDPPEKLWELVTEAQDRGLPLHVWPRASGRMTKNDRLTDRGALVYEGDLAFWPKRIRLDTRTLVERIAPIARLEAVASEALTHEIARSMGLDVSKEQADGTADEA